MGALIGMMADRPEKRTRLLPLRRENESMTDPLACRSCLVLHGLGGGPYELAPVLDGLRELGVDVEVPLLPGHDDEAGPTMPGSVWTDWVIAVEAAFDAVSRRSEGRPVAVLGFSTGATLALHLAGRRPVARLILLAPFLAIRFSQWLPVPASVWLGPIARVVPDLPRRSVATRNRLVRAELAGSTRFRTFSLASTLSALALIEQVKPEVPAIQAPTMILQGKRDSVVEPTGAAWLLANLGSSDKRLVWFARSDHLLAWDHDRESVVTTCLMFFHDERRP